MSLELAVDGTNFEEELIDLVRHDKWRNVLHLREKYSISECSRFLWAWPTEDSLDILKQTLVRARIGSLLSIGCGSGLLEWIIHQKTGIPVNGLELDQSWWTSAYSPPAFIKLNFISLNKKITSKFLMQCAVGDGSDISMMGGRKSTEFALLFCYFNDKIAFNEYVQAYEGRLIIIIGPEGCSGTVTDPQPLNPKFEYSPDYRWTIETIVNIDNFNYIGVYRKFFK